MSKLFSLLYQGDLLKSTPSKRIPEADYSLLISAQELLDKAQEDATRLTEETKKLCESLKEEAEKKGFDEGLVQFNAHVIQFEKNLQALKLELQKQILPIALKAAEKLVGKQLTLHPETIVDIVLQTLEPVMQNHEITIYVSKADKETLETHKNEIKELLEQVKTFAIQERSDITTGGCVIKTETGIINATIENQWEALKRAFQRYMPRPS